ncbi:MAG TPA: cupin [Elusimicrobia bacterium]|jgi:mannose-6-phosphate isomerase-like protein (cupin superfamily)|nr:cupin [Elusimicrobiota bacterium]
MKIVKKPWGKEIWFAYNKKYVGKIILINKGHRLSKQYHRFKHETLYTDKGKYLLEIYKGRNYRFNKVMKEGSVVIIPPKTVHRLDAKFTNVKIIEVSTPQVKDVIRLDDDYGR